MPDEIRLDFTRVISIADPQGDSCLNINGVSALL
jgi:hypothetical protein